MAYKPLQPCIVCGTLTRLGTRCEEHQPNKSQPSAARGYDNKWRRLSEQARRLQPFCSDCGTKHDLQADHSPEAWQRHQRGLPIRLQDIDVVCGDCNRKRGAARGKHTRKTR